MNLGKVENEDDYNISPEHGIKFKKSPQGFIPSVIDKILQERFRIKRQMKASDDPQERIALDVQQQAIKRLANTMYGIYGFPRFRWYSFECAKAITSWGRQYIKSSIKKAEEYGFYAIYADTDGFYAKYKKE
jgi:DNA polymerase I